MRSFLIADGAIVQSELGTGCTIAPVSCGGWHAGGPGASEVPNHLPVR